MLILLLVSGVMFQATQARTCYPLTNTSKPYHVLDKTSVQTPRRCEVFCDANAKCVGFSYQEAGLNSSCALLSPNNANEICTKPTTIFLKQTERCPDRTDLAAEYGNDPCIDTFVPAKVATVGYACTQDLRSKKYILRVVTADGLRKSMTSADYTFMNQSGDMWAYNNTMFFTKYSEDVVAAVCATAGATKCPCAPLPLLPIEGKQTYAAVINQMNPCPMAKTMVTNAHKGSSTSVQEKQNEMIVCKAGMWYLWNSGTYKELNAITAAGCRNTA
ncbi:hypothetical protein PRIPAC_75385 [Pristionchus pacificus]|uniref:Apple domain-containing protein n=1 Tax=Pristionchus pacificus TaxID=54126 RepID=H3E9C4_PRIPA|nr:hypothetical protein PRIPAC_73083 [Pristionchus pacificus]KAF8385525.1 hypothetical protein PRIPAC_74667 [Pristionchus pacificus]KAF8386243.1 hypothetical protein PRIPAC_75385 [Pristionchus pacificus]|eukprot:PDM68515.1 hypothetical protein PRIPAC_44017 [Pristionchus pacificus]